MARFLQMALPQMHFPSKLGREPRANSLILFGYVVLGWMVVLAPSAGCSAGTSGENASLRSKNAQACGDLPPFEPSSRAFDARELELEDESLKLDSSTRESPCFTAFFLVAGGFQASLITESGRAPETLTRVPVFAEVSVSSPSPSYALLHAHLLAQRATEQLAEAYDQTQALHRYRAQYLMLQMMDLRDLQDSGQDPFAASTAASQSESPDARPDSLEGSDLGIQDFNWIAQIYPRRVVTNAAGAAELRTKPFQNPYFATIYTSITQLRRSAIDVEVKDSAADACDPGANRIQARLATGVRQLGPETMPLPSLLFRVFGPESGALPLHLDPPQ